MDENTIILKGNTNSLCDLCFQEIRATISYNGRNLTINKYCPDHNIHSHEIKENYNIYTTLSKYSRFNNYYHTLLIPITSHCNLDCLYCFSYDSNIKELSSDEIEKLIMSYPADIIALTGGEPTLRDDLASLIKMIKRRGKMPMILTNGVKIANSEYLFKLKESGLKFAYISFHSFKSSFYKIFEKQETLLDTKLKALDNLKKLKIDTILAAVIFKGVNETEVAKLLNFALKNNSFIWELRLRSCSKLGKVKTDNYEMSLSLLIEKLAEALSMDASQFLDCFLCRYLQITPYKVPLEIYFVEVFDKVIVLRRFSKIVNFLKLSITRILIRLNLFRALRKFAHFFMRRIPHNLFINHLSIHLAKWPSISDVELDSLEGGMAYLSSEGNIREFRHAILMDEVRRRRTHENTSIESKSNI